MNMISNGSFLAETDASNKQEALVKKLTSAWEKKNSKTARAGGVSLMALTLAACGGEDDTPFSAADVSAAETAAAAAVDITTDNAAAVATALTDASGTAHATVDAAITSNDAAIAAAVDITTDNTAAVATALTDASGTAHATVDVAITSNDAAIAAAVDTSADDAAAVTLAYRNAAAELGVTGTSTMTDAELITAIKTANDATIAAGVDLTTDNTAAINTAVAADTSFETLAELVAAYNALVNPAAATYTLTTSVDTGASFTGGSGDDTFAANLSTLGSGDSLDGAGGTDNFILTASISAAAAESGFTLANIETVDVAVDDADSASAHTLTMNMLNSSATTLTVSGASTTAQSDTVQFDNVAAGTSVNITADNVDVTANYAAAATAGTADSVSVSLNGATATAAGDAVVTIGAGFETLNISTTGAASSVGDIVFGGDTVNVTGDQDLNIKSALDVGVDVAASAFTGDLSITATDFTDADDDLTTAGVDVTDATYTTGSGDDTLDLSGHDADDEFTANTGAGDDTVVIGAATSATSSTNAGDTINGGAGNDTIKGADTILDDFTTTNSANISGFEAMTVSDALGVSITTANIQAGITTVNLAAGASAGTLVLDAGSSNTVNIGASLAGQLTINDTGTGTTESVTITNNATAADDMGDGQALVVGGVENVTINTTAVGTTTQDFGAITMTSDTGGTDTLTFTGADAVTTDVITADVIDASGLTAASTGYTFDQGSDAAVGVTSITGSAGADRIVGDASSTINAGAGDDVVTGGSGDDTINGEAGDDTITVGAGSDTVDGGAGDDTVSLAAAGDMSSGDTITGGAGTDKLSLVEAVTAAEVVGVSGFETLVFADGATQDMAVFAANTTFDTIQQTNVANADDVTITNAGAGITTLSLLDDDGNLNVSFDRLVDGSANALTIAGSTTTVSDYTQVTVLDEETITLTSGDTAGENLTIGTLVVADATSIVVTGTGDVTVTNAISGGTAVSSVTSTAATGAVDIDASNSATGVTMTAGAGDTTFAGGLAADTITGGAGADTLSGGSGDDTINGGAGDDASISGGAGDDTLNGGAGAETLIDGGAGADTIDGGTGADTIDGGAGKDTITGGAGADTFRFTSEGSTNYDTISDFEIGTTDDIVMIDVSEINSGALSDTTGTTISAATTHTVVEYDGTALASNTAGVSIIKATALSYTSFTDVSTAIDAANITLDASGAAFGVGEGILFTFYDVDDSYASVGYIESDAADVFDDGNTYVEIARLSITSTEFASFDADNFDLM